MITDKQIRLLQNVHKQYNYYNETNISFCDFVYKYCGKNIDKLEHKDVKTLLAKTSSNTSPSVQQQWFLDSALQLYFDEFNDKFDNKESLFLHVIRKKLDDTISIHDFEQIISFLSSQGMFFPKQINFQKYYYKILEEHSDYIIGIQQHLKDTSRNLKVISFTNLMVLDWDHHDLERIKRLLLDTKYTFLLYKTKNGYHAYCVSEFFPHNSLQTLQIMNKLECDVYYSSFVYKTGFVVRLQKKSGRDEAFIEKYVEKINNFDVNDRLIELVALKDQLIGCSTPFRVLGF